MKFDGFLKVYSHLKMTMKHKNILPVVKIGDKVKIKDIIDEHTLYKPSSKIF